jgi:hypothetical protein
MAALQFSAAGQFYLGNEQIQYPAGKSFLQRQVLMTYGQDSGRKCAIYATPAATAPYFGCSAAFPRSQIGKKIPSARISTITPKNEIRIGSIWLDRVLSS